MAFTVVLKALISLTAGFVFWFFAFLVFMVYSFMPVSQLSHSIIFAVAAPILFLVIINLLMKKLFKDTGWKNYLINFAVTAATTGLSLLAIDLLAKMMR